MKAALDFTNMSVEDEIVIAQRYSKYAYIAQALGLFLFIITIWYQVYLDLGDLARNSQSAFIQSHRQWRLRSTFLFLVWSILAGFCVPFGFGILVFIPVWLWYLFRLTRGLILFAMGRVIR